MLQRVQQEFRSLLADEEQARTGWDARWRRWLRFWVLVGQGFNRNRCPIRASALAYSSLLAFVPLLAVAIGISTGILKSDAEKIRGWIDDVVVKVAPQLQNSREFGMTLDTLVQSILGMIDKVHSGTLGTAGVIALLTMILFMLTRIEETLNDIWGVTRGRSWYSRMVNYWAAISLGPIVFLGAVGFTTTLRLQGVQAWLGGLPFIGSWIIKLLPIPVLGGVCMLFYMLMPNTKVQWRAALAGGMVAGVLWHLNTTLSVQFASELTRDSAIYGSLAAVPVFMVGLFFFWMLLLFGAQVAYTYQNHRRFLAARKTERVNQAGRELVALRVMMEVSRAFIAGERAPSLCDLAERLEVPEPLINPITAVLTRTELLMEVVNTETGFAPARPPDALTVADVLGAMRRGLGSRGETRPDAAGTLAENVLERVAGAEAQAGARSLADLVGVQPMPLAEASKPE